MSFPSEDLDELLGAYALDALDPDERRLVEEYLAHNPRARAEVEQHREVATMLAYTGAAAPEGLWERIAGALEEPAPAPGPELARVLPGPGRPGVTPARRGRRAWMAPGLVAAAASIVIAVLGVRLADAGRRLDAERAERISVARLYDQARADASAHVAQLASADGRARSLAVVTADGSGFIDGRTLAVLEPDRTYQLWGVVQGTDGQQVISLGVLGAQFEIAPFTVRQGTLLKLVLTEEVRGGVPVSSQPAALAGDLV
jgi:anti-sigma factor RsiW